MGQVGVSMDEIRIDGQRFDFEAYSREAHRGGMG